MTPRRKPIEIIPGWEFSPKASFDLNAGGDVPYDGTLQVEIIDGSYECTRLELRQVPGGPPVTSAGLREIPIKDIIRTWVVKEVGGILEIGKKRERWLKAQGELDQVAAIYRAAKLVGDPPTQAVADWLAISRTYASRKVMKARDAGLLPPGARGE